MKLRIAICNERFLSRFGVDRILIILAEHLKHLGHDVHFVCLRADHDKLRHTADAIHILEGINEDNLLEFDALVPAKIVPELRSSGIDVVICGGWPFFQTSVDASFFGARSIFIDAGAVPHDGFPEAALPIQREVRRLRETTLPDFDAILPISRFIEDTQTLPDRGARAGVQVVHLGADHLFRELEPCSRDENALLDQLNDLRARQFNLLIALGRMEKNGYKNSDSVFTLLRAVKQTDAAVKLIILTGPEQYALPEDLSEDIICLPTISDAALQAIMQRSTLGLSLSLWEGFNLPIAEMQWLKKPVLALAAGAHPEIIADPWFLCQSLAEMAAKAIEVIETGPPAAIARLGRFESFRERFTWELTLQRWVDIIVGLDTAAPRRTQQIIVVDVSNSARDPANSGVIRVTRRLTAELCRQSDLFVIFAKWDPLAGEYVSLAGPDHAFLSNYSGPTDWVGQVASKFARPRQIAPLLRRLAGYAEPKPIFLYPEVILDGRAEERVKWARSNGCAVAFIFYDMLPIFETKFVSPAVTAAFPSYLAALGESDAMFAISGFSLSEYERWLGERRALRPAQRESIWLPAQFSKYPRASKRFPRTEPIELLCVSTIEPRKNHVTLIEAFTLFLSQADVPVRLNLVGNSYAGERGLSEWIQAVCVRQPMVLWHGIVDDTALKRLYECAYATIYPSLTEGFGLPIMESLWMGCPCICHTQGVMAELAASGGCMTVDMTSARHLATAIAGLLSDRKLHARLSLEATQRQLSDWSSYGRAIAERLLAMEHL